MGTIPNLRAREVETILFKIGFILDTKRGSHRTYFNPKTNRHTTVAFHPGTIPQGTLRAIIKQSGMSIQEFITILRKRR